MSDIKDVNLDFDRERRTGIAEAVFCQGKSINQLRTICDTIVIEEKPMLFTRLSESQHRQLEETHSGLLSYDEISKTAFFLAASAGTAVPVAVVSGGSSDLSVAREASRTLAFYGHDVL